jgi:PAS domain S-box-containing protein
MSTLRVAAWVRRLALLMAALLAPGAMAQTPVETPRTIRVVLDSNYPPYSFRSDEGKLQGILIDQWQAWEKKTGIKAEIHAMDWADALRRMRAGEFDVIGSIVETDARREYFDFSPGYTTMEVPIFFRKDISGIADLESLKGFPVAVKTGDQHVDILKARGVTTLILFENHAAIVEAAKQRKINVFVFDAPSAHYHLNKAGIEAEFRQSAPVFRDEIRRAVRKGDGALLRTVTDGFAAIEPGELKQIDEKWFGRTINRYGRYLTYAGYVVTVAILIIAGLVGWNRMLRKAILQRTAALEESEHRFRQIAENMHEVFWLATIDLSKTLYISPAYETLWGRSCESLHQDPRSFIAAIHPEDRPRVFDAIERDRERGFDVEYRVVRPDGSTRWISDRRFPIKNGAPHAYRMAGIAEDITERKLTVDAMKQAEDRVRLIIDTIPTMAWSVQPDGAIDFVNQRWMDYTGLSLQEEIENPTRAIHPEDLPGVLETWRGDMAAGQLFEREMRLRQADGEYRWFLIRTAPLRDERGNIVKWFGASFDIEGRKQAEMQSRALIDAIPHQIWSAPADGTVDYCNDRWRSYTGLGLEDVRGYGWHTMVHPEDRDRVIKAWSESVAKGTPYEQEERNRAADGTYRWFLARAVPLRDTDGRIIRWYGTNTDIEDRKRAEEQLEGYTQLLQLLSRRLFEVQEEERRHLARELHDEIGQNLTAAKLNLKIVAPEVPPAIVGRLEDSIQILDHLLVQVRQISLDLRPPLLDELGLVPALRWLADQQAQRAGMRVTFTANVESLAMDPTTRTACFRVAQEAITNAIRHARASTVTVELRATPDRVWLVVHDDGVGFDKGTTQQRAAQGSSVGLLSMNERASLLGGELKVSSTPGRGTEIRAWFPLAPPERDSTPEIG